MEKFAFTEEEIRNELANFGYNNLPLETIARFKNDLDILVRSENILKQCDSSKMINNVNYEAAYLPPEKHHDFSQKNIKRKVSSMSILQSKIIENQLVNHDDGDSSVKSFNCNGSHIRRKVFQTTSGTSCDDDSSLNEIFSILNLAEPISSRSVFHDASAKSRASSSSVIKSNGMDHHQRNKCDPVKRYHEYQKFWKEFSFPGEEKHSQLRWGIRERMHQSDLPHQKKI